MSRSRVLFLDAYDSFSNNIIALTELTLKNVEIIVVHIDDARFSGQPVQVFHDFLSQFDAVIAGPGPGDPRRDEDVGLVGKLWSVPNESVLPVLGICLGFQSLALAFGGQVDRLREPRHGFVTEISHRRESLFAGLEAVHATQYHSLQAGLGHAPNDDLWVSSESCKDLRPVAWDLSDDDNGPILMAVQHRSKPFFGVQYHPESVCTDKAGSRVIANWWQAVQSWKRQTQRRPSRSLSKNIHGLPMPREGLDSGYGTSTSSCSSSDVDDTEERGPQAPITRSVAPDAVRVVTWKSVNARDQHIDVPEIMDLIQEITGQVPLLLESGTKNGKPVRPETGRYSILGCRHASATTFRYSVHTHSLETIRNGVSDSRESTIQDVFDALALEQEALRAVDGPKDVPFWGGLIGYISYEAALETINVVPPSRENHYPDVWFYLVERSVVVDHVENQIYVQSLRGKDDEQWILSTSASIAQSLSGVNANNSAQAILRDLSAHATTPSDKQIIIPDRQSYCAKVLECQSHIRAGSSYELCLTDQTSVRYPETNSPSPWTLYQRLRQSNPAPFGAYLTFTTPNEPPLSILSSSPERFLSWSREGKCQFRPIKGTVQKTSSTTLESASTILNSRKERAENLMIVDLIRHDVHGVVGAGNVHVSKLMQVEEYETVYQLVSVIEGQLPSLTKSCLPPSPTPQDSTATAITGPDEQKKHEARQKTGLDLLRASLPPGSMTGAPKLSSCKLLLDIENHTPRGIYSGVLGYLDAGGGGDFSVVIRTLVGWRDEWKVGAGGAVTALSTAEGEWAEMGAKCEAALGVF
ncbi:hypothetical protein MBLNU457_7217t1 [Dothideomycetes sp. NU457]